MRKRVVALLNEYSKWAIVSMLNLLSVAKLNELRISENLTSIRSSRQNLDNLTVAQDSCISALNTVEQSQKDSGLCASRTISDNSHSFNMIRQHQSFSLFCGVLDVKIKQLSQKLSNGIEQRKAEIDALLTKNKIYQHKRDVALEKIKSDKKTRKLISESYDMADCEDKISTKL